MRATDMPSLVSEAGPGVGPLCREQGGVLRTCSHPLAPAASPQQPLAVVRVTLVSMRAPRAEATLHQVSPPWAKQLALSLLSSQARGPPRGPSGDLVGSGGRVRLWGTRQVGD